MSAERQNVQLFFRICAKTNFKTKNIKHKELSVINITIITCEELVTNEEIRNQPELNSIPGILFYKIF
jgi:acyl CoA:acetate/3-ketoacid CoA transferase alpha subunit